MGNTDTRLTGPGVRNLRDGPQARWQMVHPDEINTYLVRRFSQISHNGTYLADTSRIYES